MFTRLKALWLSYADPWPNAKPLPDHVRNLKLDPNLLYLHLSSSRKPSDRTNTGYSKPIPVPPKDKAA